ncbi:MAG: hypothetical protein ABIN97_15555 [Ginsengibacter sp.]
MCNIFGYFECLDDDLKVLLCAGKALKPGAKLLIDVAYGNFLKHNFKPYMEWINKKQFYAENGVYQLAEKS